MMRGRVRALAIALAIAIAWLLATQQVGGGYAAHGVYRAQVAAFFDGRLALSERPEALAHDLAWTPTGVQQVWGLGVPAWQTPFELIGRAIGRPGVPDRIALGAWLALVAFVALRGFRRREGSHEGWWVGAGATLLAIALPPIVTLTRGRIGVYEEAALYAYGAGIMLLAGLAALWRAPTARGYVVLVGLAGLGGLLRPTVWFYGLATLITATVLWAVHARRAAIPSIALGVALFVAGGGLLYATNVHRFGSGTEFGHRINLHSLPGNLYATRFSYPAAHAPLLGAAAELAGAAFDRPELAAREARPPKDLRDGSWKFYLRHLHAGQQELPRWREYYFTTYRWGYLPLLVAGLALAARAWRRRGPRDDLARVLGPWALLAVAPLVAFYLWSPSLSSRYLLDFAPGVAALLILAWRAAAERLRPAIAIGLLALLWIAAILTATTARRGAPVDAATAAQATAALRAPTPRARANPTGYDRDDATWALHSDILVAHDHCATAAGVRRSCEPPWDSGDVITTSERSATGWTLYRTRLTEDADERLPPITAAKPLYLNGFDWDPETGRVPVSTFFYVEDPTMLELEVSGGDTSEVRAALDRTRLVATSRTPTARGMKIRFAVPPGMTGLHVAFLAFGPETGLARPQSEYVLHAIHWR